MSARHLLAFLGVQPAEERGGALMTAHSFFMGCATVFFETAASATFLSRFASSYLPWVYIAAAGVNTVTGGVYSRVQKRALPQVRRYALGRILELDPLRAPACADGRVGRAREPFMNASRPAGMLRP